MEKSREKSREIIGKSCRNRPQEGGVIEGDGRKGGQGTEAARVVERLNEVLFQDGDVEIFPLEILVGAREEAGGAAKTAVVEAEKQMERRIGRFDVDKIDRMADGRYLVQVSSRSVADSVVEMLHQEGVPFELDYRHFLSHPGTLFVKGISANQATKEKLFEFFNEHSKYKSLSKVSVIKKNFGQTFAILKFANHLDCDILIDKLPTTPNVFNEKSSIPLYLNKYVNRRERSIKNITKEGGNSNNKHVASANSNDDSRGFDSIFVDNLQDFFKKSVITLASFETFLSKFALFGAIDFVYFPIKKITEDKIITFENFGYIAFKCSKEIDKTTLEVLYYLDNLKYEEFMNFENKTNIENDLNKDEDYSKNKNGIQLYINQHKFNHQLNKISHSRLCVTGYPILSVRYVDTSYYTFILSKFSRSTNYQKTNLYVNNLPILFSNNDAAWELFWSQFGKIKSARIIKPEYYNKDGASHFGKIGFVFYESAKMTIRAILLTNNKIVNFNNHATVIQSSFAIQKSSSIESKSPVRIHDTPDSMIFQSPPPQIIPSEFYMYPIPIGYFNYYQPYHTPVNPDYKNRQNSTSFDKTNVNNQN